MPCESGEGFALLTNEVRLKEKLRTFYAVSSRDNDHTAVRQSVILIIL
jgi:hypothetical protein